MVELAQHIMSCLLGLSVSAGFIALMLKAHRLYKRPSREEELHHTHKVSIPRFGGIALAVAFVSVIWLFRGIIDIVTLKKAEKARKTAKINGLSHGGGL